MTLDEFVKTANLRGLANKEIAREYGKGRVKFCPMCGRKMRVEG